MSKKKVQQDVIAEETPASDTIEAKPSDASRSAMMAQAMTKMASMDKSQLEAVLAQIGHEADNIADGTADKNRQSIAAKGAVDQAVKEDVAELFGSEQLSEQFKEKTAVLFESAVSARVLAETAKIEEQYQQKLEQEVAEVTQSLSEQIDHYLSYVAEQWVKQNEVAIESSLKSDLTENFIRGLQHLFAEHYVQIPDEQVDVVESLVERIDQLEDELNEQISTNIELSEAIEGYGKQEVFNEVANGLALTQVDKFTKLSETVEYGDAETYKKKLEIIKEHHFGVKTKPTTLNEQVEQPEDNSQPEVRYTSPAIENYAKAISRTIKK